MALVKSILETELSKFIDINSGAFLGCPNNSIEVGLRWSGAIDVYAGANILPASTTAIAAKTALQSSMSLITSPAMATTQVQVSFAAYAVSIGLGMTGFLATPPPLPLDLSPVAVLGFSGATSAACIALAATIIDTWFRTGLAAPLPSGTPINWN